MPSYWRFDGAPGGCFRYRVAGKNPVGRGWVKEYHVSDRKHCIPIKED